MLIGNEFKDVEEQKGRRNNNQSIITQANYLLITDKWDLDLHFEGAHLSTVNARAHGYLFLSVGAMIVEFIRFLVRATANR